MPECKYKELCPNYERFDEKCRGKCREGSKECIPFILEAYHQEKGTPWEEVKKLYE